ncbi:MAG: hypothetical protein P4M07_05240 [Xanthobacteraceae bacterium]|nr:hypothetical protein [Xanthobacteraceae bacterium]
MATGAFAVATLAALAAGLTALAGGAALAARAAEAGEVFDFAGAGLAPDFDAGLDADFCFDAALAMAFKRQQEGNRQGPYNTD